MESAEIPSLGELFFTSMDKWKDNIAQYIPHTGYSENYGKLLKKCIRTALKLQEIGITENDVVSTCTLNDENTCVPFVASQFIGAKVATLHPNLSKQTTTYLLKLVEPKVVFVSSDAEPLIEECSKEAGIQTRIVVFGLSDKHEPFCDYLRPSKIEEEFKPVPVNIMNTAIIVFTSGSTGYPKGACISHYAIVRQHSNVDKSISNHMVLLYSTLYWISGIVFLIRSIVCGIPRVLCPKFDAVEMWEIIENYKITGLILTPSFTKEFIDSKQKDCDIGSLRMLLIMGDKVTYKLLEDITSALPNVFIVNFYSQTEFGAGCFSPNVVKGEDVINHSPRALSCGKVAPDCDWKVVDPTTERILGPNENGELRLRSKFIMSGYYKVDSHSIYDVDGFIKTGDLFYYDEDKYLYIIGRLKSVFKYRNWHVSPVVVEEALMSHPAVEDAIVIDIPDEKDDNHPMGFVKLRGGYKNIAANDIKAFAEDKLGDHEKLRAGVEVVQEIPYTVTGKKRRDMFRQEYLSGIV